ncbi:restriction endonuclease subunit S [Glutamicibacter sp. AOP38-B1-38]|uniref:restriction endonuclease subunit S n=1 Tax=Glutamicibacter sp. AOP38-B1-38 TaxID=3457680 RepID=UPI0040336EE0
MNHVIARDLISQGFLRIEDGNHGNDRPLKHEFSQNGTPFIRAADMTSGFIDFESAGRINSEALNRIRKGHGRGGDVLLSHKGTVGKVAIAPINSCNFVCSPQTTLWRSLDESVIFQGFLRYLLLSPDFQRQLNVLGGQSDMAPYVSLTDQRSMRLWLPAIETQQAISEVLGALDDKIAANSKLANTADELAYSIYTNATDTSKLTPMSQKLVPVLGGTPSRSREDYWGGKEHWISARDITGAFSHIVLNTEEKITSTATGETKAKPLPKGSVILTARGTVGAVARLGEPSSFNQSCYGFVPGETSASILFFAIRSAADHAKTIAHGSVFDTITKRTFDHLHMPNLEKEESEKLERQLAPLLATVESGARENLQLAATRDVLLPQLMSGNLRVKEAEARVHEAGV